MDGPPGEVIMVIAFYRVAEVVRMTGLNRVTIWRQVKAGRFPKPVKISQRAIAWRAEDIVAWAEGLPPAF